MFAKECVPTPNRLPHTLLAHISPRMDREFLYSIFEEDYYHLQSSPEKLFMRSYRIWHTISVRYHPFRGSLHARPSS